MTVNSSYCPAWSLMPVVDPSSQRIRLFENDRLEKLTLISPRTFALTWILLFPLTAWTGWGAVDPLTGLGLVASGFVVWTLFEYVMHRYLFHLELDLPVVKWAVFLMHGNHHDCPNDSLRNMMPLLVSLPILALIWGACVALMGPAGTWALLGFATGYVIYDMVHYACHQWPMRGRLAAALKSHHMRHHYVDEDRNFAILAIFWDRVFGTRIHSLKRSGSAGA